MENELKEKKKQPSAIRILEMFSKIHPKLEDINQKSRLIEEQLTNSNEEDDPKEREAFNSDGGLLYLVKENLLIVLDCLDDTNQRLSNACEELNKSNK